jgi:hypothetical protein
MQQRPMGTMLIGYDVEWLGEGDVTPRFLEQAQSLHNRLGDPATCPGLR